ncbi:MAG: HlyD family efflux transporter periplasmic adaptor subunit [Armatimonadota bacterium]
MEQTHGRTTGRAGADSGWLLALNATLIVVLFALGAYLLGRAIAPIFRDAPRVAPAMLAAAPEPQPVVVPGAVIGSQASGIGAVHPGVVAEMRVEKGQSVRKGELLFWRDTTRLTECVQEQEAELAWVGQALCGARCDRAAALAPLEAEISALESELARDRAARARMQSRGATPATSAKLRRIQDRLEASYRELMTARARRSASAGEWNGAVAAAQRRYDQAAAEVRQARAAVPQANRYSPISGIVTSIKAGEGYWVDAEVPVVRVDKPEGLKVVALVNEEQRLALAEQDPARIVAPDGERATGEIEKIERGWDRHVFQYWVWVKPGEDAELLPGQRVQLRIDPTSAETETTAAASGDHQS